MDKKKCKKKKKMKSVSPLEKLSNYSFIFNNILIKTN